MILLGGAYVGLLGGRKLQSDLEQMLRSVSLEERDHTVSRLEAAPPREFMRLVIELPDSSEDDKEVMDIIRQRLKVLPEHRKEVMSFLRETMVFGTLAATKATLRKVLTALTDDKIDRIGRFTVQSTLYTLWETCADEELVCNEFFRDMETAAADTTDSTGKALYLTLSFWKAVSAHPDVTADQWGWRAASYRLAQADELNGLSQRKKAKLLQQYESKQRWFLPDALTKLFHEFLKLRPEQHNTILESNIFAVLGPRIASDQVDRTDDVEMLYELTDQQIGVLAGSLPEQRRSLQYRLLQKALPIDQFVRRYGRQLVRDRPIYYLEFLPPVEQKALLEQLFDPAMREVLGWEDPVIDCTPDRLSPFTIDRLIQCFHDGNYGDVYYYQDLPNFTLYANGVSWRQRLLDLAKQVIPDNTGYQSILAGESKIDALFFQIAFPDLYCSTLNVLWLLFQDRELPMRDQLDHTLAELTMRYHVPQLTATNFERIVVELPPATLQHLATVCQAIQTQLSQV